MYNGHVWKVQNVKNQNVLERIASVLRQKVREPIYLNRRSNELIPYYEKNFAKDFIQQIIKVVKILPTTNK